MELCTTELDPLVNLAFEQLSTGSPNREISDSVLREISKILAVLEKRFKEDHRYLVGYGPSYADISIAAALTIPFWNVYKDYLAGGFPFVTKWLRDCHDRFCFASVNQSYSDPSQDSTWLIRQAKII